jgi:hypothetical protein
MTRPSVTHFGRQARDESGIALIVAVILLLLMSALGLNALRHSGSEASESSRARRKDSTFYGAEAGLHLAQIRLLDGWGGTGLPSVMINEAAITTDAFGNDISARTSAGDFTNQSAVLIEASAPKGDRQNGFKQNIGSSDAQHFVPCRVGIVAQDTSQGMVFLQAQYKVHLQSGGY